jgi:integrative and conjugative element protein (TIGR02256 family)
MQPSVTITRPVADAIAQHAAMSADGNETGGIVIGHDLGDSLAVTAVGGPGPNATRTPNRFLRDLDHAQQLADEAYDDDGSVWIGEWHTHPTGPAQPSPVDLATYADHLANPALGFRRFLAFIVLPCPTHQWEHINLAAWVIESDQATLVSIHIDSADIEDE